MERVRKVLSGRYSGYMETYIRFRDKIGPQCIMAKKAATYMYLSEVSRSKDFIERFDTNEWMGYS